MWMNSHSHRPSPAPAFSYTHIHKHTQSFMKTQQLSSRTRSHLEIPVQMSSVHYHDMNYVTKFWHIGQEHKHNQSSSVIQSCPTLCDPMDCRTPVLLSITNSWSLPKLMSIESVMPFNQLILPPSIFPSIRVFSNESIFHMMRPKYWSFSFSISPSSEHPGLTSFRMDWLDLLAPLYAVTIPN